jgi:hypothetical protein
MSIEIIPSQDDKMSQPEPGLRRQIMSFPEEWSRQRWEIVSWCRAM